jgi:hypothetical protein
VLIKILPPMTAPPGEIEDAMAKRRPGTLHAHG